MGKGNARKRSEEKELRLKPKKPIDFYRSFDMPTERSNKTSKKPSFD